MLVDLIEGPFVKCKILVGICFVSLGHPVGICFVFGNFPTRHYTIQNDFKQFCNYKRCQRLKGAVSVISSDPPCKNGNARFTFTTIPLKLKSAQKCERYCIIFLTSKVLNNCTQFHCCFLYTQGMRQSLSQRNRK